MSERTILLVEDDEDIRDAVSDALQRKGYRVSQAEDGRQGLERLRAGTPPRLILLDLTMPVMSGWEMLTELAKDEALAAIPVIVMSAVPRPTQPPGTRPWAGLLVKPVSLGSLLDTVAPFFSP